jgi:hypothetical protein
MICSARIVLARLLLVAVALAVCCVPACALGEWRVEFELALERHDYHEGEMIHAAVAVMNTSADAIRMAYVFPINKRLLCAATRQDGTQFVDAFAQSHTLLGGDESVVLGPGESRLQAVAVYDFDQLDEKGEPYHYCEGDDPPGYLNRTVVVNCPLPPGRYTMRAQSDQKSYMLPSDTMITEKLVGGSILYSNTVPFTVWSQGAKLPAQRGTAVAANHGTGNDQLPTISLRGMAFAPQAALEQLGVKVARESTTVTLTRGQRTCQFPLGLWGKGGPAPAVPSCGGLYLPLRTVAQALGLRVNWDPVRRVAEIRG